MLAVEVPVTMLLCLCSSMPGRQGMRERDERLGVDLYLLGIVRGVDLCKSPMRAESGVVDEHVDVEAEKLGDLVPERGCCVGRVPQVTTCVGPGIGEASCSMRSDRRGATRIEPVPAFGNLLREILAPIFDGCTSHERHLAHGDADLSYLPRNN